MPSPSVTIRPRIRIAQGAKIALGPGKADLLEAVSKGESLSAAARQLKMSYMRAWLLVKEMDAAFGVPVIEKTRGGRKGGGAKLTDDGRQILKLYREMETASMKASRPAYLQLKKLLD